MNTCMSLATIALVCGVTFGASNVAADGSAAALSATGCAPDWITTFGGMPGANERTFAQ